MRIALAGIEHRAVLGVPAAQLVVVELAVLAGARQPKLAGDFLGGGADMLLTEMKDEELLKLVTLDLGAAMREG